MTISLTILQVWLTVVKYSQVSACCRLLVLNRISSRFLIILFFDSSASARAVTLDTLIAMAFDI